MIGQMMYAVMAFALAGSLIGFLIYNFSPAKIFMGDTGSLLIGLLNSVFVIKFITVAADPNLAIPVTAAPAIGFAVLIVPLFDTLRVFSLRIINRRSPFSADRNHIHHFLLDLGLDHKKIVFVCLAANIIFIGLAWSLQSLGTTLVIGALASAAVMLVGIIYYSRPRPKIIPAPKAVTKEADIIKTHTILSLAGERIEQD
jgi:UDP-N-acetylmuramyl pentapeptide phosphotransferase/UDP-N-acetylglucosamine-1-phosphate transferase